MTTPNHSRLVEALKGLPGADIVLSGIADLREGKVSENALLVLIASPRLLRLGVDVPKNTDTLRPYEHRLYALLETSYGNRAYSRYNSLLRRIASFVQALERQNFDIDRCRTGQEAPDNER